MEKRRYLKYIVGIILLFCIIAYIFLVCLDGMKNYNFDSKNQNSTIYTNVNVSKAKEMINSSINLTIIYCEGGCKPCSWKKVKIDSSAIWATGTKKFWNSTNDFLIYDKSGGNKSIDYCERLSSHVYGTIYRLDGGFEAWKKEN